MGKTFFGFAIADSMLPVSCIFRKSEITTHEIRETKNLVSCLNPSHAATIAAMRVRFGLEVPIPEKAPQVSLSPGDKLIVMGVRGLPRLDTRHEYTREEIDSAEFVFSRYEIFGAEDNRICHIIDLARQGMM